MVNYRSVLFILGILLSGIAAAMLAPLCLELLILQTKNWQPFAYSFFMSGVVGIGISLANRPYGKILLGTREAFLVTALAWFFIPFFAGLPFYWSGHKLSIISSCFEAVSALTTTGATVLTQLEKLPQGVLLWRAIMQWLGGTGIIVMAMTIFPTLRIGGMQLFRSEFSDRSEKILPRVSQIAAAILITYSAFTLACGLLLYVAGMGVFDAICHAMTTVSTGGLSTRDGSIGAFDSVWIELIITVFMIIGGSTLILYIRLFNGDKKALTNDSQTRAYLGVIAAATILLTLWQIIANKQTLIEALRHSSFHVVSIITSTGFSTHDYTLWGQFPQMLILFLGLLGGCTGSTTGGIKVFRVQVLATLTLCHLRHLRRPHGVYIPLYNRQKLSDFMATSVFTFVTLYCFVLIVLSTTLSVLGLDFTSSFSGAAAALGNVGPGLGAVIGPASTYGVLSDTAKMVMMVGMIIGRLELLTVLVLFMPSFWRD